MCWKGRASSKLDELGKSGKGGYNASIPGGKEWKMAGDLLDFSEPADLQRWFARYVAQ